MSRAVSFVTLALVSLVSLVVLAVAGAGVGPGAASHVNASATPPVAETTDDFIWGP
ncbi:hypothetical protein JQK87_33985 [Streptomyces sp. G44]|uniref:hypothetical protein n=1 Tax=Streptomyces sp. G44 TaxID=2807632 RepID=UPI00195F541A|nr:hypothetical protein [Streptomyces sp. G44]MBM7173311.1 hypothetical protein [Streptomyces sp. G44]